MIGLIDKFPPCLAFTLRPDFDGQPYHVTPGDHGGATAWGVTQATYDGYRDRNGLQRRSVALMEPHERESLYRDGFWQPVRGDDLPSGVNLSVFDFGVGAGPRTSAKLLQRVVGEEDDGVIGPMSMAALGKHSPADLIGMLAARYAYFYRSLDTFDRFGNGWLRRNEARRQTALAMVAA